MTAVALVTGAKYWAGASRPFYVGQGMVTTYLQNRGFANVRWHKRTEPLPAGIDPRSDTAYSDDWDEWVSADYVGKAGSLSPPTNIPWLIVYLPSAIANANAVAQATGTKPPWVTASQQAGQAAYSAAQQAASAQANGGVSSVPAATTHAPRATENNVAAAVSILGGFVVLGTLVAAILGRKRR